MRLSVLTATYHIPGKSLEYMKGIELTLRNQKFQNFDFYLIGDNYEDKEEFDFICKMFSSNQQFGFKYLNLDVAVERSFYGQNPNLWYSGGANAYNKGIEFILDSGGSEFICHLDHDDVWYNNHLELISGELDRNKYSFIATKAFFGKNEILPKNEQDYGNFYPRECDVIHSATCINFKDFPLRYLDVFRETNGKKMIPSDADMWYRMEKYMKTFGLKGRLIKEITCKHDQEKGMKI